MRRRTPLVALAIAACSSPPPDPPPPAPPPPAAITASAPASPPPPPTCTPADPASLTVFVSPSTPRAGVPLRVLAHSEEPLEGAALSLTDASGAELAASRERRGGPPFFWTVEIPSPAAGTYRVALRAGDRWTCNELTVTDGPAPRAPRSAAAWPVRAAWDRAAERLYSAWVEKLFDAPLGAELAVPALHEILRDPAKNLLHDHLGEGEDDAGPRAISIKPDCADLPYFLRAYFAHKLGLPFGYSSCTRGGGGQPPSCRSYHTNLAPHAQRSTAGATLGDFLRVTLADTVHSGTGRTPADRDDGDYYPVPISFASLRPGTVYADPYGHVLVVAKRIPQTATSAGVLLAVDGQPDGTVARRRFWRGNFLFAVDPALGSAGWKRFRPVVVEPGRAGRALGNAEITAHPAYGDLSLSQYAGGVEGFYDAMDDALSPAPLDPARALGEVLDALEEQVKGRVLSVGNAKKHFSGGGERIDMPEGPAIFETVGPWEDFSTPSRDLRLLIAVDVARGFPDRVARRPERYAMPKDASVDEVRRALAVQLAAELGKRTFAYERSDGESQRLTLADVVTRAEALEVAYDPNDCPEIRWGAAEGSDEAATCKRRAPGDQQARMRRYRPWFRERRRPPRG
jgi:hypothetical protein